jgi:F-type H+-transporting ATPase subunit b
MNINLTLLGQMITFAVFVWFTMKFVWPPVMAALAERQKKIADGLAAAERGAHELELAQHRAVERLREAKEQAGKIIETANARSEQIIADAQQQARIESDRIIAAAQAELVKQKHQARAELQKEIVDLVIASSEKLIGQRMNADANKQLVERFVNGMGTVKETV